jgi:hypothetical protein
MARGLGVFQSPRFTVYLDAQPWLQVAIDLFDEVVFLSCLLFQEGKRSIRSIWNR